MALVAISKQSLRFVIKSGKMLKTMDFRCSESARWFTGVMCFDIKKKLLFYAHSRFHHPFLYELLLYYTQYFKPWDNCDKNEGTTTLYLLIITLLYWMCYIHHHLLWDVLNVNPFLFQPITGGRSSSISLTSIASVFRWICRVCGFCFFI